MRAVCKCLLHWGQRISAVAAQCACSEGVIASAVQGLCYSVGQLPHSSCFAGILTMFQHTAHADLNPAKELFSYVFTGSQGSEAEACSIQIWSRIVLGVWIWWIWHSGYILMYSRLSLFRLSEVWPPRYTVHLAWHGMLAICLLQNSPWSTATRYSVYRPVGLDKLCFFFGLLFLLTILKKSAYYSSLVYPLFQFKDVTFINSEKTIYLWLSHYWVLLLRKIFFQKRKYSIEYCDYRLRDVYSYRYIHCKIEI